MPSPIPQPLFPGYPIFKDIIFFLGLIFLAVIALGVCLLGVRIFRKLTGVDRMARRERTRSRSPNFWRRFVPGRRSYGNFEADEEPDVWAEGIGRGRTLRRADAWRGRLGRGRTLRRLDRVPEGVEIELEEIEGPIPVRKVTLHDEPGEVV